MLVASALLTLAVMSAIVAYHGFPGQDVQSPVGSVLVQQRQAPVTRLPKHPAIAPAARASRSARAVHAATVARQRRTAVARTPVAHATPVVRRQEAGTARPQPQPQPQPQQQSSSPVSTPDTSSLTKPVTDTVPQTPSLPSAGSLLPSTPSQGTTPVPLPQVPNVDPGKVTSGVTNTVGKVLGQ